MENASVERESVGKRIRRFFGLMGIIFAITLGVVVTERLSNDALALLVGLGAGVAVMSPLVALVFMIWRRQQEERDWERSRAMPSSAAPPVVVVTPPALPGYQSQQQALWGEGATGWAPTPAQREFTIVGGER